MAVFGLWVIAATTYAALTSPVPSAATMGSIGALALFANTVCALLLFRYRGGDANIRSVWLCSRNDALGNLAVMAAATGVFASGTHWPDIAVAAILVTLAMTASFHIVRQAWAEPHDFEGRESSEPVHESRANHA